jgi:hypothetical protein
MFRQAPEKENAGWRPASGGHYIPLPQRKKLLFLHCGHMLGNALIQKDSRSDGFSRYGTSPEQGCNLEYG